MVRKLEAADLAAWLSLWHSYLQFYETAISSDVTKATWARILHDEQVHGLGVINEGQLAGFALFIVHPATWSLSPTLYLEDFFVASAHRGLGLGRLLLNAVVDLAQSRGCSSIYWHTNEDNRRARSLYDSYCAADNSVGYRMKLGS